MAMVKTVKMERNDRTTTIWLPTPLWEKIQVLAIERKCKFNDLVVQALTQFIEQNPPTWRPE